MRARSGRWPGLFLAILAIDVLASDLEITSTTTVEENGRQVVVPCVKNNSTDPHQARFTVGSAEWNDPLRIPPGGTACFRLDSTFMKGRGIYELEVGPAD